jgi:hypothetical protein
MSQKASKVYATFPDLTRGFQGELGESDDPEDDVRQLL